MSWNEEEMVRPVDRRLARNRFEGRMVPGICKYGDKLCGYFSSLIHNRFPLLSYIHDKYSPSNHELVTSEKVKWSLFIHPMRKSYQV